MELVVKVKMDLDDGAQKRARSSIRDTDKAAKALKATMAGLFAGFSAGVVVREMGKAVDATAKYQDTLLSLNTLVGVNRELVEQWRGDLRGLSVDLGQSQQSLGDALFVITSAGERGAGAMEILEEAGRGAAVGLGDTAQIARVATAAIAAYGKENITAEQAVNAVFETIREGNLEAASLAPVIGRLLGLTSSMGVEFEEAGSFIATYTRLGGGAEDATVRLQGVLQSFLKPGAEAALTLAKMGTSADEVRRKIADDGLAATLVELRGLFGDNEAAIAKVIPESRALAGFLGVTGDLAATYLDINDKLTDSQLELAAAFRTVKEDSPGQKLREARVEVENLKEEIGAGLLPIWLEVLSAMRDVLRIGELIQALKIPSVNTTGGPQDAAPTGSLDEFVEESAAHWERLAEAQRESARANEGWVLSSEEAARVAQDVARGLAEEERAAALAARTLKDFPDLARQIEAAELEEEIAQTAAAMADLLGAAAPSITVLLELAEKQVLAERAAKAHKEELKKDAEAARFWARAQREATQEAEEFARKVAEIRGFRDDIRLFEAAELGEGAEAIERQRQSVEEWSRSALAAGLTAEEVAKAVDLMNRAFARDEAERSAAFLKSYEDAARSAAAALSGPMASARERFALDLEHLNLLAERGAITTQEFWAAVRQLNQEFASGVAAQRRDILREIETQLQREKRIREEILELEKAGVVTAREANKLFKERAGTSANIDSGHLVAAGETIGQKWKSTLLAAGKSMADNWQSVLVSVLNIAKDFGRREEGKFGGRLSGDFENEGRQIGQALGSLFVVGGPVFGEIFGAIGSAIKKGADEGLATLRQVGDDVATDIFRNEGGLGWVLQEIGAGFTGYLNSLESMLRGEIEIGGGGIGLKVRDDLIHVFANGITGTFETIEEATEFAIIQALRSAESIQGASPEVQAALRNFAGETLAELDQTMSLALEFETARLGDSVAKVGADIRTIFSKIAQAINAGIPIEGGIAMLEQTRASLLGLEQDIAAQKAAEIDAYNAALTMQELSIKSQILEIETMGLVTQARGEVTRSYAHISEAQILADGARIQSMAAVTGAQAQMVSSSASLLLELKAVLDSIEGLRITGAERAAAIARAAARRARNIRVPTGGTATSPDPTADLREELERLRIGSDEAALAAFEFELALQAAQERLAESSLSEEERAEFIDRMRQQFADEQLRREEERLEAERRAAEEALRIQEETRQALLDPYRDALASDDIISRRDELLAQRDRDLAALDDLIRTRADENLIIEGTEARIRELNEELAESFQGLAGSVVGFFQGAVSALPEGSEERERLEALILGYKRDQFRFELEQHRLAIAQHELELEALGLLDDEARRYLAAMREGLDILDGSMQEIFDDMSGATEEARLAAEAAERAAQEAARAVNEARRGLDSAAGGVAGLIRRSLESIRDPQERIRLQETLVALEQRQFELAVLSAQIELESIRAQLEAAGQLDEERAAWIERFLGDLGVISDNMTHIFDDIADDIRGAGEDFRRRVAGAGQSVTALRLLFPELFPVTSPPRDPQDVGLQLALMLQELFDLENPTGGLSPGEILMQQVEAMAPFFEAFGLSIEEITARVQDIIDSEVLEDAGASMQSFIDLQRSLLPGGALSGDSDAERLVALKAQIMSAIAQGDFQLAAQLGQEAISIAPGVSGAWMRDIRELLLSVDTGLPGTGPAGTVGGTGAIRFEGLNAFEQGAAQRFSVDQANKLVMFELAQGQRERMASSLETIAAAVADSSRRPGLRRPGGARLSASAVRQ